MEKVDSPKYSKIRTLPQVFLLETVKGRDRKPKLKTSAKSATRWGNTTFLMHCRLLFSWLCFPLIFCMDITVLYWLFLKWSHLLNFTSCLASVSLLGKSIRKWYSDMYFSTKGSLNLTLLNQIFTSE